VPVIYHPESESYFVGTLDADHQYISCREVNPSDIPAFTRVSSERGFSTVLPDFDFETFSTAGYEFDEDLNKWVSIVKSPPHGLGAVGAVVYSEHPSTEVLSLAYNLKDGLGPRLWLPGMAPPDDLFAYIAMKGVLEAWNCQFEYHIWANVCVKRMGWPELPYWQLRDAMAKARAFSVPGKLEDAAKVLDATDQKLADGKRLIKKFSMPKQPSKKDPRRRIRPEEDYEDANKFYDYNLGDIKAESAVSAITPDLSDTELELWLLDQRINLRGVHIDPVALSNCLAIVNQAFAQYTAELVTITGGTVQGVGEIQKITGWLGGRGLRMASLDADHVAKALKMDMPATIHPTTWTEIQRVLEIRSSLGAASVKKLYSIDRRLGSTGRLLELFAFCGADRTGRFAGRGPQPQNLPNSGPPVRQCGCGKHYAAELNNCPWCNDPEWSSDATEWGIGPVEDALAIIGSRSLAIVEHYFGDAIAAVSGCLRGLFSASPGCDLICSDYSAIEAVVLAMLAGEQWRIDVFRTHGKIYEMSAAKITGIPFEEFIRHKEETGDHHPLRKKIGKVAELASGYQGSVGAWKAFGADKHMENDAEIKAAVDTWRKESPNIVRFWYGVQDNAIFAIQNPGQSFIYKGLIFSMVDDTLFIQLLSGRKLSYHTPRLIPDVTPWGKEVFKIVYMGRNTYTQQWCQLDTYGGKLVENITQATARDILTYAMVNIEKAGYGIVLHIHDEIVSEVLEGTGSVEEFEKIMAILPPWAADWPIRAAGGWRGKRYRKD